MQQTSEFLMTSEVLFVKIYAINNRKAGARHRPWTVDYGLLPTGPLYLRNRA